MFCGTFADDEGDNPVNKHNKYNAAWGNMLLPDVQPLQLEVYCNSK